MAFKTNQAWDLSEHKRQIVFEHLSPRTTKETLEEYLSEFQLERCVIPYKEGRSQCHAFVTFSKESSVKNIMSKRPHRIDGQLVEVYRSLPDEVSLKGKKGVKNLIVSGIKKGSITQSDLERYFDEFGTIDHINMTYDEDSCCIEFNDYDAVDKALLDIPHTIKRVELNLKKGNQTARSERNVPSLMSQPVYKNNTSVIPKESNLKQEQIDPPISSVYIPKKFYCIHIMNLPSNASAELLSKKFSWDLDRILINAPINPSSSIECWLKGFDELEDAEEFVEFWNGQMILRSKIECEVAEDKLEFCYKFRNGQCPRTSEDCDWEHIMCTANGKCSNDCLYGHEEGMKTGHFNDSGSSEQYRLKITGFQKKLTPELLTQIFHGKKYYVNRHQENVAYIIQLRTMKYARRLLAKWNNKEIDGQKIQCQIELNPRYAMPKMVPSSGSISNLAPKGNDNRSSDRSHQQRNNNVNTSPDHSISGENSDPEITTLDDQGINDPARLLAVPLAGIVRQKTLDAERKSASTGSIYSSVHYKFQNFNETAEDGRQMTVLRKKTDHASCVFLVKYRDTDEESYRRELNALKLLKGVKGVVQLVELENPSDDDDQQFTPKNKLEILAEHMSGYSLKEFVDQIHRGGFGVLEAIQLVQNLISIIEQVHSKGVFHQNLRPENIMIKWDSKQMSMDQAELLLINFSQAYIKSEKTNRISQSETEYWYKAPQLNIKSLKYSSTIDASSICAILLWLLTNTDPSHDHNLLPHQPNNVMDKMDKKIAQAVRNTNVNKKQFLEETQLKTYLTDTFNIGFGYPQHQPWIINDLECRLESIRELLSPRNPKLNTTEVIFKELISTYNTTMPTSSTTTNIQHDIFQKASIAFQQAKTSFSKSTNDQYSWSDGSCTWLESTQTSMNECRHDDILTYSSRDRHISTSCSIIITCLATLIDEGNCITLSIGSAVNGKMSRIPIGHYSKSQNYIAEFEKRFIVELNNLIISIAKEQRAISQ